MRFISFGIALVAASARTTLASAADLPQPPLPPWYPLKPWEITSLSISHPHDRGYGANASSLLLRISNPSYIPGAPAPHASGGGYVSFNPSAAQCELHWETGDRSPYGSGSTTSCVSETHPNDYTTARWNVTLLAVQPDLSGPGDYYFGLSFTLSLDATIYGTKAYKFMGGSAPFRPSTNLEGQCVEGGLCEYRVKNESLPVLLQPTLQECKTACG